jgi:hypothetical protein
MSNERKRWTLKESDRAIELCASGVPYPGIAEELGRTAAAVEQHIIKRRNPSSMLNHGASKKTKLTKMAKMAKATKATKTGFSFYDFAVGVVIGFSAASVAASYLI